MNSAVTKEELTRIIDGLHLQMVWVRQCIDSLEYLENVKKAKLDSSRNFWYIARTSMIYRFSMELAKLFDEQKGLSIKRIKNMCTNNSSFFDDSSFIVNYCRDFTNQLKSYSLVCNNIKERRDKTYGHNDRDYYLFSQKAIDDFPLNMGEIKNVVLLIYNFAVTMQEHIGSERKELGYPAFSDDVKRLFGEKTKEDIWLESE